MWHIRLFVIIFLIYPALCIGDSSINEKSNQNLISYEKAIELSKMSERLAKMKLATYFPDLSWSDKAKWGISPEVACKNMTKDGFNCWFEGGTPFLDAGFTLGEFTQSILNTDDIGKSGSISRKRCLYIKPLELRIYFTDKDSPYMSFIFEEINSEYLVVNEVRSSDGDVSSKQDAGMALRFFYSPSL